MAPWWSKNPCWDDDYDGVSEPKGERQELTRNGETVADSLTGKPEEDWNNGTPGFHECDYTANQHAQAWEHIDVDTFDAMTIEEARALVNLEQELREGTYEP